MEDQLQEIPLLLPLAEEGEQDCACGRESASFPDFAPGKTPELSLSTPLRHPPGLYWKELDQEHSLAYNPQGFSPPHVLNHTADRILNAFRRPLTPEEASRALGLPLDALLPVLQEMAEAGLLIPASDSPAPQATLSHSGLVLWLALTFNCNLRCRYCYVPLSPLDMTEEDGRKAVDWAIGKLRERGWKRLKLKYAGGEPLLRFDLLKSVHGYARRKAQEAGVTLREVVITNGTLLEPDILSFLRDEGIAIVLSIDGLGPEHGYLRPSADGEDSLPLVLRALDLALKANCSLSLLATITSANLAGIPELVGFAMDLGLPLSLNFCRSSRADDPLLPAPEGLVRVLRGAWGVARGKLSQGKGPIPVLDLIHLASPSPYPCRAGLNFFAFGPGGTSASCPMLLGKSGGFSFKPSPVEANAHCRWCRWRYLCGGGCPLSGDAHRYCLVYRELIPLWLELEASEAKALL